MSLAMAFAPLSLVQAVLAGGVVLLAIMAERTFGLEISRRQWIGHRPHRRRPAPARPQPARRPRRPFAFLASGHDRLRGRAARGRDAAHHGPADRRSRSASWLHARRRLGHPVRCLRRGHQGHLGHGRRPRPGRPHQPLGPHHRDRLGGRLLQLGQGPAGRRRGPGDRRHRYGGQRVRGHWRDHRLRRPALRPSADPGHRAGRLRARPHRGLDDPGADSGPPSRAPAARLQCPAAARSRPSVPPARYAALQTADGLRRLVSVDQLAALVDSRPAAGDPRRPLGAGRRRPSGSVPRRAHPERGSSWISTRDLAVGRPEPAAATRCPTRSPIFEAAMRIGGRERWAHDVVYDAGPATAAARAWWLLRYFGHPAVAVLDGGLAAWIASGQPLETGPAAPVRAGDFSATAGGMPVLDAAAAARLAGQGGLLDARAPERFQGEAEPVDPVAGHIPGALNRPTTLNVGAAGPIPEPGRASQRIRGPRGGRGDTSGGVLRIRRDRCPRGPGPRAGRLPGRALPGLVE